MSMSVNVLINILGSGFLDPVLALNPSTEWNLDNLSTNTEGYLFNQSRKVLL